MKKKEDLYEEMVYTTRSSSGSSGNSSSGSSGGSGNGSSGNGSNNSSGSNGGSGNSSFGSGNSSLPLGELYLNRMVSRDGNLCKIAYGASCANAQELKVTLNCYPSGTEVYNNFIRGDSINGIINAVWAGDYILKAVAKTGKETTSRELYTPVISNSSCNADFYGSFSANGSCMEYKSEYVYTGKNFISDNISSISDDMSESSSKDRFYVYVSPGNRGIKSVSHGESILMLCNNPETITSNSVNSCGMAVLSRKHLDLSRSLNRKVRLYAWHARKDNNPNVKMTYRIDIVNAGCPIKIKFSPHAETGRIYSDINNWREYSCGVPSDDLDWYKENYPDSTHGDYTMIGIGSGSYCNLFVKELDNSDTIGILGELEVCGENNNPNIKFDVVEYVYLGYKDENVIQCCLNNCQYLASSESESLIRGSGKADIEVTSEKLCINNLYGGIVARGIGMGALNLITDNNLLAAWKECLSIDSLDSSPSSVRYNEGIYGVTAKINLIFENCTDSVADFDIIAGSGGGPSNPILKLNSISTSNLSQSGSVVMYSEINAIEERDKTDPTAGYINLQGVSKMMTVQNVKKGEPVTVSFEMEFPAGGNAEYIVAVLKRGVF